MRTMILIRVKKTDHHQNNYSKGHIKNRRKILHDMIGSKNVFQFSNLVTCDEDKSKFRPILLQILQHYFYASHAWLHQCILFNIPNRHFQLSSRKNFENVDAIYKAYPSGLQLDEICPCSRMIGGTLICYSYLGINNLWLEQPTKRRVARLRKECFGFFVLFPKSSLIQMGLNSKLPIMPRHFFKRMKFYCRAFPIIRSHGNVAKKMVVVLLTEMFSWKV